MTTAQSYIQAFESLALKNNTMIVPSNVADISGVAGSALAIYKSISNSFDKETLKAIDEKKKED